MSGAVGILIEVKGKEVDVDCSLELPVGFHDDGQSGQVLFSDC